MAFQETSLPAMTGYLLTDAEFSMIQRLIYDRAGVYIKNHKKTMVANRLRKRLENYGFESYKKYMDFISRHPEGNRELIEFVNCLTTNETFFFRHGEQLELLTDRLIPLRLNDLKEGSKLRIWSAACSSGEEPYSIAMLMHQKFRPETIARIEILASDINMEVLEKAKAGLYKPYALQKVSSYFKSSYFRSCGEDLFRIDPRIQEMVRFSHHNLLEPNLQGPFDIILCRNVLIYFDLESKNKALNHLYKSLKTGGCLITGYAESLYKTMTPLKYVQPTLYSRA